MLAGCRAYSIAKMHPSCAIICICARNLASALLTILGKVTGQRLSPRAQYLDAHSLSSKPGLQGCELAGCL